MVTSSSRLSYIDAYEVLDRALAARRGVRITFEDVGAARSFQLRLNKARALNREDNAETYPAGEPLHGRSEYDTLLIQFRSNGEGTFILVEKIDREMQIEEIEDE